MLQETVTPAVPLGTVMLTGSFVQVADPQCTGANDGNVMLAVEAARYALAKEDASPKQEFVADFLV